MRFSVYRRFEVELLQKDGVWRLYRRSGGVRTPDFDVTIPPEIGQDDLITYLDDVFHEYARAGDEIVRLE